MPESPLLKALERPEIKAELAKPDVKQAFEKIKETFWKGVETWTADQWIKAGNALVLVIKSLGNIPQGFMDKITGSLEGSFFAAGYGLFIAVWAQFELTVEILIMRQLRLTAQEASIVCGGLSFGSKIHVLLSLLSRDDKNDDGILLLKQAQEFADRNSFAHGFLYDEITPNPPEGTPGYKVSLLKREVKYQYVTKLKALDVRTMAIHVLDFHIRHQEIKKRFGITEDDAKAYQKSILDEASARKSQAERHRQSQTSARTAKQKQRGLQPQSSQPKSRGPRPSAKQRRAEAMGKKPG